MASYAYTWIWCAFYALKCTNVSRELFQLISMKCSLSQHPVMISAISRVWISQNLTQEHLAISPLNILEPNFGIYFHLIWKILTTYMYLKAIYINGVSQNKQTKLSSRWNYNSGFSFLFYNYISFLYTLFPTIFSSSIWYLILIIYNWDVLTFGVLALLCI